MGDVSRVSPEAPIPILQVSRIEERPGNAGFVMANLRALGARGERAQRGRRRSQRCNCCARCSATSVSIRAQCWSTPIARPSLRSGCWGRCNLPIAPPSNCCASIRKRRTRSARPRSARSRAMLERELRARRRRAHLGHQQGLAHAGASARDLSTVHAAARSRSSSIRALSEDFSIYSGATALTPNRYETEFATGTAPDRPRRVDARGGRADSPARARRLPHHARPRGMYLVERGGGSLTSRPRRARFTT